MFKITGVYKLKHLKNKYRIYLEDDRYFDVSENFMYKFDLKVGMQIHQDEYEQLCKEMAYQQAIYFISYQDRTIKEVRNKLKKCGHDDELIDEMVSLLIDDGYLDDYKYANAFVESKLKKYGRKKIVYDLVRRGVSKKIIDVVLSDSNMDEQINTALECANKKLRQMEDSKINPYKKKQRVYALLCRRGYDYEIVKSVMEKLGI